MKKPHLVPLAQHFLRSQYRASQCIDEHFYIRFDGHSASFEPVVWSDNDPETINNVFQKFQAVLKVYNEKHFHRLQIHFYECTGLKTSSFGRLGSQIGKHFRNLSDLTLVFFACDKITEKGIKHFLDPISKSLKSLRRLNISVLGYIEFDNKGVDCIRKLCLTRLKKLKKLELIFSGEQTETSEKHLPYETNVIKHLEQRSLLGWMMKYLSSTSLSSEAAISLCKNLRQYNRNLQQLTLAFPDVAFEPRGVSILSWALQRFTYLKTLYLGLNYNETLEDDNMGEEICTSLQNLSSLQSLMLSFGRVNFIATGFISKLSGVLSRLQNLRQFGISLISELIKDNDLNSLTTQICLSAKNLEHLTLSFDQLGDVSNQAIKKVINDSYNHLSSLKELIFNCRYTTFSNKYASQIVPKQTFQPLTLLHLYLPNFNFELDLSNCCRSLRELNLSFDDCRQISDKNFMQLLDSFSNLHFNNLNQLALLFNQARLITDESFKSLCYLDWTHFPNLKHLALGFVYCDGITDSALDYTRLIILEYFKGLSVLELSFKYCRSITENGIKLLCNTICRHMMYLKGLVIDFSCVSILVSKPTVEAIVNKILACLKELERLRLNFINTGRYDVPFWSQIRKKLCLIPNADFYYSPPEFIPE